MDVLGISGENLVKLSGYVALGFFILNFMTCFAMPWSKDKCPWKGECPGPDEHDKDGKFMLSHYHHYFTWVTIIAVIIHFLLAKIVY